MAGSETDALRSGRVLKRERVGESNMWHVRAADDHKVPLLNELLTHISHTDSVKQEKFWCSVHRILMLLFFHLMCVATQNMFGFFGFIYIRVCVCVYINMHCFNAVNNAQNYQVNPAVSETTFTTRWKASRATYNESQQLFYDEK